MNQKANSQYPQYAINELINKFLLFDLLHAIYEEKKLNKRMLSACLHMSIDFRNDLINYLGLSNEVSIRRRNKCLKLWITSAKIPPRGEGLTYKGLEHIDYFFAWFNRVRFPKEMKAHKLK